MLGTLLDKLEPLLSKAFLISSFFPFLIFSFVNCVLLYVSFPSFQKTVDGFADLKELMQGFVGFTVLIAITVLAYAFSTLNLLMREILEGKHLRGKVKDRLIEHHQARLNVLNDEIDDARKTRRGIRRERSKWVDDMLSAREEGKKKGTCSYDAEASGVKGELQSLRSKRRQGKVIRADELAGAVTKIVSALKMNSTDVGNDGAKALDGHHEELFHLVDYAEKKASAKFAILYTERQFNYPPEGVEPTAMGNIAESAWGHAQYRYGLNLSVFWNSLLNVAQKDEKFHGNLLNAKLSLDFMVSICWLSLLFTLIWLLVLPFCATSFWPFLGVWSFGPVVVVGCYFLALQNYRAFAHIVRTTADLFRLDLIKTLGFPRPSTMAEERQFWEDLTGNLAYDAGNNLPYRSQED